MSRGAWEDEVDVVASRGAGFVACDCVYVSCWCVYLRQQSLALKNNAAKRGSTDLTAFLRSAPTQRLMSWR